MKFIKGRERVITPREASYWKDVFHKNLKIGSEIEMEFSNRNGVIEAERIEALGNRWRFGNGVETIKGDGSLNCGVELLTPGRRIYGFIPLYNQYKMITDKLLECGAVIKTRASWHNHLLLDYYSDSVTSQELPLPQIVVKNILIILKSYNHALSFMTSTAQELDCDTRYNGFCQNGKILKTSLVDKNIREIHRALNDIRYNWFNLLHMKIDSDNDITRFHIELRFPDSTLFPAQMAALNVLFASICFKAIEYSQFGLASFFEEQDVKEFMELSMFKNTKLDNCDANFRSLYDKYSYVFENNLRTERASHKLKPEYKAMLIVKSNELVDLLIDEIENIDSLAVPILRSLANKPISQYKASVGDINNTLDTLVDSLVVPHQEGYMPILELIVKGQIKGANTLDEWINRASEYVACKNMKKEIEALGKVRKLTFIRGKGLCLK